MFNRTNTNTVDSRTGIAGLLRTRWAAIGAAVAVSVGGGGIGLVHATVDSGERPVLVPLEETCRLADTRPATVVGPRATPIGADETYTLDAHGMQGGCDITSEATALSLNVTAVDATQQTNLRFFGGTGPVPDTASMNPGPGQPPTPNAITVDLDDNGQFSIFNKFGTVHVVVDVIGFYEHHNHDDEYIQLDDQMWAVIESDGDFARFGRGVTWSERTGEGEYVVTLGRDISDCTFQATVGRPDVANNPAPHFAMVSHVVGDTDDNQVAVWVYDAAGSASDYAFHLLVTCTPRQLFTLVPVESA